MEEKQKLIRLKHEQISEIEKKLIQGSENIQDLASIYQVSRFAIMRIKRNMMSKKPNEMENIKLGFFLFFFIGIKCK